MDPMDSISPEKNRLDQYVKLNIGGHLFQTTIGTLTSQQGMLKSMLKGDFENKKDSDGFLMIDRDGEHFREILNFLRRGSISLSRSTKELEDILAEAEFYQIEPLVCMLKEKLSALEEKKTHFESHSNIVTLTTEKEMEEIVKKASKPIICLQVTRSSHLSKDIGDQIIQLQSIASAYSDVFLFVLLLLETSQYQLHWMYYLDGERVVISSLTQFASSGPMLKFFAKYLRNLKAQNSPQN
ncbi:BTB/POZ domain-containing adapter for CUL3-mediated RhoA degradation protein 3-like [Brevipalpus obovatus]|uniref:BTB/POZ domain-containing adapter for CUL3-mediated RhoA degradation protein 3-like n=1 Tax=Brevipalpus obovatus TaxID=246614 RepID=UPI003D9EAD07